MNHKRLWQSFGDAFRGLVFVFKNEQNFRIQIGLAILVGVCIVVFPLKVWEIILLILMMVTVLGMELLNTAIERLSDLLKPRLNSYIGNVKDIMAAAVLITSLGAVAIGIIILYPHFLTIVR